MRFELAAEVRWQLKPSSASAIGLRCKAEQPFRFRISGDDPGGCVESQLRHSDARKAAARQFCLQPLRGERAISPQRGCEMRGDRVQRCAVRGAELVAFAQQDQPDIACGWGVDTQPSSVMKLALGKDRALPRQLVWPIVVEHFVQAVDPAGPHLTIGAQAKARELLDREARLLLGAGTSVVKDQRLPSCRGTGRQHQKKGLSRVCARGEVAQEDAPGRCLMDTVEQRQEKLSLIGGKKTHAAVAPIWEHRGQCSSAIWAADDRSSGENHV